jgi:sarcosine oxidase subunit gamma
MARKGVDGAMIGAALGLAAPSGPARAANGSLALVATGPGVWLALADQPGDDWPQTLEERLGDLAAVSDQSGAYLIWRIAGPGAGALLQKGAPIDLDGCVFGPGAAATTMIAHVGVILWRLDEPEGFEVAVFRSYARDFEHWLQTQVRAADMS